MVLAPCPADDYLLTLFLLFPPPGMSSLRAAVTTPVVQQASCDRQKSPALTVVCPVVTIAHCLSRLNPLKKEVQGS